MWKSTGTATIDTQQECEKRQEADDTPSTETSERACSLPSSPFLCLCHGAWQIEKARKADHGQFPPLLVPIGTLSRRNKSLRSSGVLKVVGDGFTERRNGRVG